MVEILELPIEQIPRVVALLDTLGDINVDYFKFLDLMAKLVWVLFL